jgi:hypothetical protein
MIPEFYACGACESMELKLVGQIDHWDVSCGNGHRLIPDPSLVITIVGEPDAPSIPEDSIQEEGTLQGPS